MNRTKRFLFNTLLWLAVWLIAWLFTTSDMDFLQKNVPVFVFQVIVISTLIYLTSPQLLFKKKYVLFGIVSLALIALCSFILSEVSTNLLNVQSPPMEGPPPPMEGLPPHMDGPPPPMDVLPHEDLENALPGRPPSGPPQFLIHFLALSTAYILATFVETFMFAQKKEEEIIVNKNEALQTELKLLKSQINPHFLFNSLNNIYTLSAIDIEKTQRSISYLSDMLRYVLYECEQESVPLEKEITYIENYVKLFSLKSSKEYPIVTDFKVANKGIKIAPMLFIPFMENALKHGNIEKITDTFVRIEIDANTDSIQFEIENSKSENPKVTDDVGGIGIENVKKRLAILYPNRHELSINETSRAFKVNLNIELNGNH